MSRANSVFLVCECGFFYGDMRLHENAGLDCPECGADAAAAFAALGDALTHQEQIRGAAHRENGSLTRGSKALLTESRATEREDIVNEETSD